MGFQQGLSGLSAASKNLEVIGNKVANSNAYGEKASRAEVVFISHSTAPSACASAMHERFGIDAKAPGPFPIRIING